MAYGVIRSETVTYNDEDGSHNLLVELLRQGAVSPTNPDILGVDLSANDITLTGGKNDVSFDPDEFLFPKRVEFEIRDTTGIAGLLVDAGETEFRIRLTEDGTELFEGYLALEANQITLLEDVPKLSIVAYDGLSILKEVNFEKGDYLLGARESVKAFLDDIADKIGIDKGWVVYCNYTDNSGIQHFFPKDFYFKPDWLVRDMDNPTYFDLLQRFCNMFNFHCFQYEGNWVLKDFTSVAQINKIDLDTGTVTDDVSLYDGFIDEAKMIKNEDAKFVFSDPAKEILYNLFYDTEDFILNEAIRFSFGSIIFWDSAGSPSFYNGLTGLPSGQQSETGAILAMDGSQSIDNFPPSVVSNDGIQRTVIDISVDIQILCGYGSTSDPDQELYIPMLSIESIGIKSNGNTSIRRLECPSADPSVSTVYGTDVRPDSDGIQFGRWDAFPTNDKFVFGVPAQPNTDAVPRLIKTRKTVRIVADEEEAGEPNRRWWAIRIEPNITDSDTNLIVTQLMVSGVKAEIVSHKPYGYEKRFYINNLSEAGRKITLTDTIGTTNKSYDEEDNRYFFWSDEFGVERPIFKDGVLFPEPTHTDYRRVLSKRLTLAKFSSRHSDIKATLLNTYSLSSGTIGHFYGGKVTYFKRNITRGYTKVELASLTLGLDDYRTVTGYGREYQYGFDWSNFQGFGSFSIYAGINFSVVGSY